VKLSAHFSGSEPESMTNSQAHGSPESPLLIAQMDSPQDENTGDFYYRTYAPAVGMAQCENVRTISLTNIHRLKQIVMREADVLVMNNICDADLLPVIRDRKASGKLTVYELCDDLDEIPPSNPVREFYARTSNLLLIKRLAHYCDALQFSSTELMKKYGYLNPNRAVFPNHILEFPPERGLRPGGAVAVGWGGSIGHLHDMERIADRLIQWIAARENVCLHLMCGEQIWRLFDRLPGDRKKRYPTGSRQDYYSFVSQLDIGIAPLEDTPFNRSRSDVKFLEYAVHGVVPVVQATGPYLISVQHGRTGFLYRSRDELISTLDRLVSDHSLRTKISAAAREYVLRERNQFERGLDRTEFYRRLLAGIGPSSGARQGKAGTIFDELCGCEGARRSARHLHLAPTRCELLLHDALTGMSRYPDQAREMFLEAARIQPDLYMPYLFGAFLSEDPIRMLKTAVEKNPRSIVSRLHLGRAYSSMGMAAEAVDCCRSAAGIFPGYEQPYIECADYLNAMGLNREGVSMLKKAIELIPEVIKDPRPGMAPI